MDTAEGPPSHLPVSQSVTRMCRVLHAEDLLGPQIRLGSVLKHMDICACIAIERAARRSCVTASMDHLVFDSEHAVRDGDAMLVEAKVVRCFNSSAEVVVRVVLDPSLSANAGGRRDVACVAHAFFVFVRLDHGPMPTMFPQTASEVREYELALERRQVRQKARQQAPQGACPARGDEAAPGAEGGISCEHSLLEFTHIVLPTHANHMGNLFGGEILEWAEQIATLSATKHLNAAVAAGRRLLHFSPTATSTDTPTTAGAGVAAEAGSAASQFSVATVYVSGMSFLRPSSVGDRIVLRAQCCRTFGTVAEIEVEVTASDVARSSERHINTGYFVICCRDSQCKREVLFPPVQPTTLEEHARFGDSLRRMVVACVRSASAASLDATGPWRGPGGDSARSSLLQLSQMLAMQEASIWNSSLPSSLALSPRFEVECAAEFALQDVSGLLCALSSDARAWSTIPRTADVPCSLFIQKGSSGLTRVKLEVSIRAPVEQVASLILDLDQRSLWDTILVGSVVRDVAEGVSLVWMGSTVGVDYALLRCHRVLGDGRVAIVSRSILHPDIAPPARRGGGRDLLYLRGEVLPSGFLLTGFDDGEEGHASKGTKLQYLLQLDALSTEEFSDEIRGNEFVDSLISLKTVLEKNVYHNVTASDSFS